MRGSRCGSLLADDEQAGSSMTIALSILVNDGLVLATDSASTILVTGDEPSVPAGVSTVYNNASKVFRVIRETPIGGITWGSGSIGVASISTLMQDFRAQRKRGGLLARFVQSSPPTVRSVAGEVRGFLADRIRAEESAKVLKPSLGILIAGYSPGRPVAEQYVISVSDGQVNELETISDGTSATGSGKESRRQLPALSAAMELLCRRCSAPISVCRQPRCPQSCRLSTLR